MNDEKLLGLDITDCDPRQVRTGVILGVTATQLWVEWNESGVKRWVSRGRMHHNANARTGYYVPQEGA